MRHFIFRLTAGLVFSIHLSGAAFASSDAAQWRDLSSNEKAAIERSVTSQLKDPQSATFKWGKYNTSVKMYCGLVNSKNSYGGYAGDTPFSVFLDKSPDGAVKPSGDAHIASDEMLGPALVNVCTSKGYYAQ